ncbi:MAG: hypothetical protein ACYTJ0_07995, partial [Planctomycetota bacterium]
MRRRTFPVLAHALAALLPAAAVASPPLATAGAVGGGGHDDATLRVMVDPRVELMSLIFRLAGSPEYTQGRVPSYAVDADLHF